MHYEFLHTLDAHPQRLTALREDLVAKRSITPGKRLRITTDAMICAESAHKPSPAR